MIEMNTAQVKMSRILTGLVQLREMKSMTKFNGTILVTPQNIASVSSPLGGFVKNTTLFQGSSVVKGQILAEISNFEFIQLQQDYLETKAKFEFADIEYKRHSELYKENVYSEKNVQQVETEYKTQKAKVRSLEQKLLMLGISPKTLTDDNITGTLPLRAPIDGYLKSVNINIGKYVNPSDVLFEIVNPNNVVLELVIFEKDIQMVKAGQKVLFSAPNFPEREYSGILYQAGRVLDNDKTANAYARIDSPDETLLSGMYVNAQVETDQRRVTSIQSDAVVRFNEKFFVFIFDGVKMENGKEISLYKAIEVNIGLSSNGFTEIGLPKGIDFTSLKIVIKGSYTILSAWKNAGEMAC